MFSGNHGSTHGNRWESDCPLTMTEWMATRVILYNLLGEKRAVVKGFPGSPGEKKKWGFILVQQSITRLLPKPFHVTVTLGRTKRVASRKKMINRSWKAKLGISQARNGRNRTKKCPTWRIQFCKQVELWNKTDQTVFIAICAHCFISVVCTSRELVSHSYCTHSPSAKRPQPKPKRSRYTYQMDLVTDNTELKTKQTQSPQNHITNQNQ